jgi:hypothetical protein
MLPFNIHNIEIIYPRIEPKKISNLLIEWSGQLNFLGSRLQVELWVYFNEKP